MKNGRLYLLVFSALVILSSVTLAQIEKEDQQVADMTICEKVNALVEEHQNGFERIRKNERTSRWVVTWSARYHLIGNDCEVWKWGRAKFNYMCQETWPVKEMAMEDYEEAKRVAAECLGDAWTMAERPRERVEGMKAVFRNDSTKTVVSVYAVASPGLFSSEWTTYYFVGDEKDAL